MTWRGGMLCALTGVLLAATGCWTGGDGLAFLRFNVTDKGRTYVARGSVATASLNVQAALQQAGLFFTFKRNGEEVLLKSTTPSGRRFTLVLKEIRSAEAEQTQINVEWENEPD